MITASVMKKLIQKILYRTVVSFQRSKKKGTSYLTQLDRVKGNNTQLKNDANATVHY